ncbi:hypothetical protein C8E03_11930 [Lachnotalea glycerini]|uniref:Uncharacterized protein n=1 Tax=Lachnotalea glycerini TaxID=1763509 RepID=A0A318EIE2_9FIRM|nr:hypothetical protein [Lachnotalea glycerini]PXV85106.1 hypothetical protein C8E03_11930 [Lachnotalea glycerini]
MYKSQYMEKVPNSKEGLARVLDMGSTINKKKYGITKNATKVDEEAIHSDWEAIGTDIRRAIDEFRDSKYHGINRG